MRHSSPPAFGCWFLELVLPGPYREAILGDLIEEYTLRIESMSRFTASRWFWSQACRSVPPTLWSALRSRECLISMSAAVGAYVLMRILEFVANRLISKLVPADPATHVVLAPIVFLTATAIAGVIAARIRRGATIFLALMVMVTVAVAIELKVCTIPVPWWYEFGFLTLGPLAVIITPKLFARLKQHRAAT